jgi:hypothetical protein
MSERVIDNPSVAGWELNPDTGYWMWAGTSTSTGKWEDGPDDSIYYDKGNVLVGAGAQSGVPLSVRGNGVETTWSDGLVRTRLARFENAEDESVRTTMTLWSDNNKGVVLQGGTNGGSLSLGTRTGAEDHVRMTIDATGDATFSGEAGASNFLCRNNGVIKFADAGNQRISRIYNDGASSTSRMAFDIQDSNGWIRALDIAADGNATFGAAVTSDSVKTNSVHSGVSGRAGVLFGSSAQVLPCDHNGNPVDDTADLGRKSDRFRQGWFSKAVSGSAFKTFNVDDGSDVLTIFGRTIYSENGIGFYFPSGGTNTILPCRSSDGDTTDGIVSLGNNIKRFKNLFLTGSVLPGGYLYQNGGEAVLSVDVLLDAFKELRTATADESSVETLRDAMSNCLGGLIERLEGIKHDADAAREEMIEDVSMPEVGTMDIQ